MKLTIIGGGGVRTPRLIPSLVNCLRWGNGCGGLSTLANGGTPSAPNR